MAVRALLTLAAVLLLADSQAAPARQLASLEAELPLSLPRGLLPGSTLSFFGEGREGCPSGCLSLRLHSGSQVALSIGSTTAAACPEQGSASCIVLNSQLTNARGELETGTPVVLRGASVPAGDEWELRVSALDDRYRVSITGSAAVEFPYRVPTDTVDVVEEGGDG